MFTCLLLFSTTVASFPRHLLLRFQSTMLSMVLPLLALLILTFLIQSDHNLHSSPSSHRPPREPLSCSPSWSTRACRNRFQSRTRCRPSCSTWMGRCRASKSCPSSGWPRNRYHLIQFVAMHRRLSKMKHTAGQKRDLVLDPFLNRKNVSILGFWCCCLSGKTKNRRTVSAWIIVVQLNHVEKSKYSTFLCITCFTWHNYWHRYQVFWSLSKEKKLECSVGLAKIEEIDGYP